MTALAIVIAAFCALWWAQAAVIFRNLSQIADLARTEAPEPGRWPSVSVVIPARDEATDIAGSLETRLSDGYPGALELVVVDDRSTDATPAIIAEYAARDPRVKPVRIDELPGGWLGKVHALSRGAEMASGEWLLFSDADVHVAPGMLARAVAHCEAGGFDLLALIPEFRSRSGIVDVLWAVFVRVMAMSASPDAVRNPRSRVAVGSGGYTLVRRSAYDATPGFEHLRLETADDMALGSMVKQAGAHCEYMNGRGAASVSIYNSVAAFYRGVEKNGSSLGSAPFVAVLVVFACFACLEYSPLIALGVGLGAGIGWLAWLGAATTVLATAATVTAMHRNTGMVWPGLLWPIGWALVATGVLRSAWLFHRRGGAMWRGTFYPKSEVLESQRFKLG